MKQPVCEIRVGIQQNMEIIYIIFLSAWHSKGFSIQCLSESDNYGTFRYVEKACSRDFWMVKI